MVQTDSVDDAIILALSKQSGQNYTQLFENTKRVKSCARETFNEYLKQLVNDNLVIKRKEKGKRTVTHSLNHNNVNEFKESVQKECVNIKPHLESLQKFTRLVSKIKPEEDHELFIQENADLFVISIHAIADLLNSNKLIQLSILTKELSKTEENKLKRIQESIYTRIFDTLNATKRNLAFHKNFLSQVFRSTQPFIKKD